MSHGCSGQAAAYDLEACLEREGLRELTSNIEAVSSFDRVHRVGGGYTLSNPSN